MEVVLPVVQRVSVLATAKNLVLWGAAATVFGGVDYYFQKTSHSRVSDVTGYFFNQVAQNLVRVSRREPSAFEWDLKGVVVPLVMSRVKGVSFHENINYHLANVKSSILLQPLHARVPALYFEGFHVLKELPSLLPVSVKITVTESIVKACGVEKRFAVLKKLDLAFLSLLLSNFEIAEHIVKGWSGTHHVNGRIRFSLHWLLLVPCIAANWHWTKKDDLPIVEIEPEQVKNAVSLDTIAENKKSIQDDSAHFFAQEDSSLKSRHKRVKSISCDASDEKKNPLYVKFENLKIKQQQQRRLFFWNIAAILIGFCFHALLDTGLYWYSHHSKV